MKILVFSDTHLTHRFERKKYSKLKEIIFAADQVIINGDFWDGAATSFERFINSDWIQLFPMLKQKNTIYIYGNHDKQRYTDERVALFSAQQTHRYTLELHGKTFIIEHGHQTQPAIYEKFDFLPRFRLFVVFMNNFFSLFERLVVKFFGNKTLQQYLYGNLNKETKQNIKNNAYNGSIYICGHTHSPEIDLKNHFINTGFIRHGIAQYLVIDNGKPELKEEKYA